MMTAVPMASAGKKLSFAKVAASGATENMPPSQASRVAVPTLEHRRMPSSGAAVVAGTTAKNAHTTSVKSVSPTVVAKAPPSSAKDNTKEPPESKLEQGMKDLSVASSTASAATTPSLVVNGSSSAGDVGGSQGKTENGTAAFDDVSQKADSSSEIGTKAPSLDGKSITSGTTFALDEKESLRPDDSASVKAAAEDDEAFSVRGSQMANSRIGSEVARVHRLRIGDMPERRIIQILPESHEQGVATPQSGSSGPPPPAENPPIIATVSGTPDAFSSMYAQNPDDKLIEAMSSPKDRMFLLRLEQDVIQFVQSSTEPYMDLPPNNSFCRMLTHKLADYYHMTHSFEAVQGAVRIYRTPFCRVPPSLAGIVGNNAESNTNTALPVLLPKKIMRRGEDDGSGQASNSPSKATSEVGSDGKDKSAPAKEKMSREQREEAYNKARERIFGSSEKTGESTPENDEGVSRASSVSAKEKSNLGKKKTSKQRRDDSESFDSRSIYQPYYANPGNGNWAPQYIPIGAPQFNGQVQQPFQNAMPQAYPQSTPMYPQMMPQGPMNGYQQYSPMPTYPPQNPQPIQQRYPQTMGPMPGYGSPMQNAPQSQQAWQQPGYNQNPASVPPPFQQPARGPQTQGQGQGNAAQSVPYPFGQLPANGNPNDPKSQHPIPGSYNRHAFNPKTQSFVPGNGMSPQQPFSNPHGSPQVGSPHMGYNGYSSPVPPQPYMGGPPSYGMSRQSSTSSIPGYHPHGTQPQHLPQHGSHLPPMPPIGNQMPPQMASHMPQPVGHQMQNKNLQGPPQPLNSGHHGHPTFSSLPNYGNPATLPQKPPNPTGI